MLDEKIVIHGLRHESTLDIIVPEKAFLKFKKLFLKTFGLEYQLRGYKPTVAESEWNWENFTAGPIKPDFCEYIDAKQQHHLVICIPTDDVNRAFSFIRQFSADNQTPLAELPRQCL